MRNKDEDPSEELGSQLSPSERVVRVQQQLAELDESPLSDWETNFIKSNEGSKWPNFTPRQEAAMQKIEQKVFGEELQPLKHDRDELTGQLKFKNK